jgi:hypothetical protein
MITLSQELFEREMETTNLNIDDEAAKACDEDPFFIDFVDSCEFSMASVCKTFAKSTKTFVDYEEACRVLKESLYSLRYLLNKQIEENA